MKGNGNISRTQEKINHLVANVCAGIDVSKDKLDFAIHGFGVELTVSNDKRGIQKLIREYVAHDVNLVALEATGKFHRLVHETLHEADIPVAVVNPFRSRQFADSIVQLAKTDNIDARILAKFAALLNPEPTKPISIQYKKLKALLSARRQLVDEIGDMKRKLKTSEHPLTVSQIRARIKLAETHRQQLEQEIHELIQSEKELNDRFRILTSIPNIGTTTAALMLADLAELGRVDCRQIAALAGVASLNWVSGVRQGTRSIRGGRTHLRKTLYMCAVSAISKKGFYTPSH